MQSHTRLLMLGTELILVSWQSQVILVINPVVGCHYFPPGPWLISQPKRSPSSVGTKLYCLMTEAHRCK